MVKKLFPTQIYENRISKAVGKRLNHDLLKEIAYYAVNDKVGLDWSKENYKGGYTSYNSLTNLQDISPTFEELQKWIDTHVKKYVKQLDYNLMGRKLKMTTCWINVMPKNTYHPLHNHPLSVVSGTYYVKVPAKTSSLKIEDTKMAFIMSAPPRKKNNYYYHFHPKAGDLVLFESWVKHEVPPNPSKETRISVSFNYEWL